MPKSGVKKIPVITLIFLWNGPLADQCSENKAEAKKLFFCEFILFSLYQQKMRRAFYQQFQLQDFDCIGDLKKEEGGGGGGIGPQGIFFEYFVQFRIFQCFSWNIIITRAI